MTDNEMNKQRNDSVDVLCAKCGRRIGTTLLKINTVQVFNCRNCWKMNVYDPTTGECKLKPLPERKSSSGMTFI